LKSFIAAVPPGELTSRWIDACEPKSILFSVKTQPPLLYSMFPPKRGIKTPVGVRNNVAEQDTQPLNASLVALTATRGAGLKMQSWRQHGS
uniref:Uncharacterized protein n=1 Tax=Gasterosteus aculeatus aculeatus TaxID=481459 RepID=A0AAQ4P262_GASAC